MKTPPNSPVKAERRRIGRHIRRGRILKLKTPIERDFPLLSLYWRGLGTVNESHTSDTAVIGKSD